MPRLDEGSILVESRKLPGISLTESVEIGNRLEKIILEFPEVDGVVYLSGAEVHPGELRRVRVSGLHDRLNAAILANIGYDLQAFSGGRFVMGLGSQIKPHITKRFSMPWSQPAARMRELVQAMRAIWACWNDGTKLDFRGDFYQHTLMTPMFSPGPNPHGSPPIFLAGYGPRMAYLAATTRGEAR